jgi:hypothetical protein
MSNQQNSCAEKFLVLNVMYNEDLTESYGNIINSEKKEYIIVRNKHSLLSDLEQYHFPDDIKNGANVIYNKMTHQVRRGKKRNQLLFFCVYCSYLEEIAKYIKLLENGNNQVERILSETMNIDPFTLGLNFDLKPGEVQHCFSIFSPLQTGYKPPSKYISPLGYLSNFCHNMNISQECIMELMKLGENILQKAPTLYQENPRTVGAALFRYIIEINGIKGKDPNEIISITGKTNNTISEIYRRISDIDNA